MNNYERFRALVNIISTHSELTWSDLEKAGISKGVYANLEKLHLKEIEDGVAKDDAEAYEAYKKEFMDILFK